MRTTASALIAVAALLVAVTIEEPCRAEPVVSPTPAPVPVVSANPSLTPAPTERVQPVLVGQASTYGPGYDGYIAVPKRDWMGKHVSICYEGRCIGRWVNDLGPDQRVFPDRVVDLDVETFQRLCLCHWTTGILSDVTVTLLDE